MARLRLGVIGAGAWSVTSHLPNLAQRDDEVEFVAVCRRGEAELQRVAERFGFPIATEDYREVLAAGVDLCVVASPTGLHHEHAKAAMEAGAHVLVEKPFTITAADAWGLVDTAARTDRHLVISYGWNYLPLVGGMKALIDEHGIGTIEHVVVHMGSTTRELLSNTGSYPQADPDAVPEQATWTDPELSGGGYAQAQLTHALGISLWLTGLRGAEAFALMSYPLDAPVELHDAISVRYDNGAIGTVSGGSAHVGANGNKNQGVATDLARQAADRAGQAASWLQDREPEDLLEDVRAFARRRPGAFLGIALAAGVVAGRLTRGIKAAGDDDAPGGNGSRPLVSGTGTTGQVYRSGGEGLQSPSAYPPAPVGSGDPLLPGDTR